MTSLLRPLLALCCAGVLCLFAPAAPASYANFETVPVRPLALSPDGNRLFAVNTPDARLEIFDVTPDGIEHRGSVPVGLDPVSVAARTPDEVWVVNHLSDSVSIVDVGADPPRVARTLLVGDEPWDVVFGGERSGKRGPFRRAFVSAARRGQNHPERSLAELKTPGLGWADVWVFDAEQLGAGLGGTPEKIVRLFGDKPRPLAVTPDGRTVYAGIFLSGNQTTTINPGAVCDGGAHRDPCTVFTSGADDPPAVGEPGTGDPPVLPGGLPGTNVDLEGVPGPENGLIVRFDEESGEFRDELGRNWNGAVPFDLPDLDVFAIDATANPPVETAAYASVGTILFNMTVGPDGLVYVANTEARNEVRFEGSGERGTTVRGHLHEARITVIDPSTGSVSPRHLNAHIDYAASPQPAGAEKRSLATPHELAFTRDGLLYVAAFGSQKLGVFKAHKDAQGGLELRAAGHIPLSDGGPAGLLAHPWRRQLYAYTRFSSRISVINTWKRKEVASIPLHNPEPEDVRRGRPFLYDARESSSNGEASCSSCHVHGDNDALAWDLGNPDGSVVRNNNPFFVGRAVDFDFHPLKGPMLTQTLRGLQNHGPMHWRGDRTGAAAPGASPQDALDEVAAFVAFNGAFESLLGRDEGEIPAESMLAFARFALGIFPPPNPHRDLDNVDRGTAAIGRRIYFDVIILPQRGIDRCNKCHVLDPVRGFFGTAGLSVPDPEGLKVPHLRNVYDRVGAHGLVALNPQGDAGSTHGDQVRGFGLSHTGSVGSIETFLIHAGFDFPGGVPQRRAVNDFLLGFPSNMAPIVGQQVTLRHDNPAAVGPRIDLMISQARTPWIVAGNPGPMSCDLVVRGVVAGEARGFLFEPATRTFRGDRASESPWADAELRALAQDEGQPLTYTCGPPGSGPRLALDRDEDGVFDADEIDGGTDPSDPESPRARESG